MFHIADMSGCNFLLSTIISATTYQQGLPVYFCKEHLPDEDEMITLVDEDEDEFPTKYLAEKNGLSGGWRGFAIDHELVDGDALVFQLINPTTFKVSSWTQIDAFLVPF